MAEVTTTLENLVIRDVTARGELTKVYEVVADGRKFSTFKRPLAEKAAPLKGLLVTIEYTEKQKGEFTNYYLDDISQAPSGATGATETPSQDTLGTQSNPTLDSLGLAYTGSGNNVGLAARSSDKDISIARAVALKAAVETATGLQIDTDSNGIIAIADTYLPWLLGVPSPLVLGISGEENPFADLAEPVDAKGELVKF